MTESIFVPFKLTTREACEKAIGVLTSEPTPWPKSEEKYSVEYLGEKETADFFNARKAEK